MKNPLPLLNARLWIIAMDGEWGNGRSQLPVGRLHDLCKQPAVENEEMW